jgi:hypothetical protein
MYVAYTYASLVFYVSAIESFLLLIYANSVVLLFNWKGIIPDKLRVSLENKKQKRDLRSINEELRTLSHVNLIEADKWLSEIYGIPFFDTVLGNAEFKEFRIRFDDLSSKRNDIVHRGGENKKGKYTDVNFDELDLFHADAEKFGKKTAQFLYQWWVGRFQENPDLVKAVFKSI